MISGASWLIKKPVVIGSGSYEPQVQGDDGYKRPGSVYAAYSVSIVGKSGGIKIHSWVRFPGVAIPKGSTITSASITFEASESDLGTNALTNIYFNDSDDAVAPTSEAEYNALSKTSAFVAWDTPTLSAWTGGDDYTTPDISTVVQEVIDRESWSSGNAMMLMWEDDGGTNNAERRFRTYDDPSADAPEFNVVWEE